MGLIKKFRRFKKERRQLLAQQSEILDRQNRILARIEGQGASQSFRRPPIYVGDGMLLAETAFNRKIYLDAGDSSLTPHIALDGIWEAGLTTFWQETLKPGQTFVDIGANCGFFALLAAHLVGPDGAVVAVEPQARLAGLIQRSFYVNGFDSFARVAATAIGETEGTAGLEKSSVLSGSASIPGLGPERDAVEEVTVKPLGQVMQEVGDAMGRSLLPDAMKIDSEGYEWLIWLGASELLARCERIVICLEFSPLRYHDMGDSPAAFLDRIQADGFTVGLLEHDGSERRLSKNEIAEVARVKHGHDDLILRKGH